MSEASNFDGDDEVPGLGPAPGLAPAPAPSSPSRRGIKSVSSQALFTSAAQLLSQGAAILTLILMTPLFFAGLGERLFGVYQLAQRMGQFSGLTNLGATSYLKIRLAEMSRDESAGERRKALSECLLQWLSLTPILALWIYLVAAIINARSGLTAGETSAVIVLILLIPLAQILSLGYTALFTHGLGYYGIPLSAGIGFAASGVAAALAYAGYGIQAVAAALAAGVVLNGIVGNALARRLLPWFGLARPNAAEFRRHYGKSWGAATASMAYLGLQQLEYLTFGLVLGPMMLARLVLTCVGVQLLEILVRSFIGTAAYAIAPFIRDRESGRIERLREEAHANIIVLFALAAPPIIGLTPFVVAHWVEGATTVGTSVLAAVLLTSMFRLLATFDSALLDQAREFNRKVVAAVLLVFIPVGVMGFWAYRGIAPAGWPWLLPLTMALFFAFVAVRCRALLRIRNMWRPLVLPIASVLVSLWLATDIVPVQEGPLLTLLVMVGVSAAFGVAARFDPRLRGPIGVSLSRVSRGMGDLIRRRA